jgi:hypothetical protein
MDSLMSAPHEYEPVSVKNLNENLSIHIYPNPVLDVINIQKENTDEVTINIYNILGQRIVSKKIAAVINSIDCSSLNRGVYILEVINNQNSIKYKFEKL